jgi:hypothetical protein
MKLAAMTAFTLLTGSAMAGGLFDDNCRHTAPRNASTPAAGITKVVIHADAGSLQVDGVTGAATFAVTGTACTSDEDFLPRMTLVLRKVGSELHIDTSIPDKSVVFGFFAARLDFAVSMPEGLPVVIDDGSGSIQVTNSGSLTIDDESGSIEVKNVRGNVLIRDDSGSIDVDTVQGNVKVEDDSGSMEIQHVSGNVEVEDDSGSISVSDVSGSLRITEDDSGSILAQNIRRDVTIDRDSSGGVEVADIGGNFTVHRKSAGGIDHIRVAGKINIPSRD